MDCSICFDGIKEEDRKNLNCVHVFHEECINKWFKISHQCPLCRKSKFDSKCGDFERNYWERVKKSDELIKGETNIFFGLEKYDN
jgi:hypothetical protein|tara:strand:+ start:1192 stop:1446 length:255 start_codon:yes stop_codon:yes gene_type:complete